jgi:integration host factor subunit alpha
MTLSKARLVEQLTDKGLGMSRSELHRVVNSVLQVMSDNLEQGQKIKLSGFGNFEVSDKTARVGRNPHTEESLIISRRRVLGFKASQKINMALNIFNEGRHER